MGWLDLALMQTETDFLTGLQATITARLAAIANVPSAPMLTSGTADFSAAATNSGLIAALAA